MAGQEAFENLTDGIMVLLMSALVLAVYLSWLASYRTPKSAPVGSSLWFKLPAWGQIAVGLGVSLLGVFISYALWKPLPLTTSRSLSLLLRIGGVLLISGGTALWFWSRQTLGTMMGVSTGSAAQLRVEHRLIQAGPYAFVRHPMYLSYWLVLVGLLISYRTWMPLLALTMMLAALVKRARREDQVLATTFGEAWQRYAKRVPMFLPRWQKFEAHLSKGDLQ